MIYEIGEKKLNYYVDYLEVITLLQEFTKLKKILFDKQRLELFKFSKKQSVIVNKDGEEIYTTGEKAKIKDNNNEELDEVDYEELFTKYKNIVRAKDKREYDKRLIDEFDNDIKMPFDIILEKS